MTNSNPFLQQLAEAERHFKLGWITQKELDRQRAQIQVRLEQMVGQGALSGAIAVRPGDAGAIAAVASEAMAATTAAVDANGGPAPNQAKLVIGAVTVLVVVVIVALSWLAWRSTR